MGRFELKKSVDASRRHKKTTFSRSSKIQSAVFQISRTLSAPQLDRRQSVSSPLDSVRTKSHHLSTHRQKIGLVFTAVCLVAAVLIWFLVELTATVDVSLNVAGLKGDAKKDTYQKLMENYISENPLSRFRSLLDKQNLTSYLDKKYPEVLMIQDMGKNSLSTTEYRVTFRRPVAGWQIGSVKYYVDSNGMSFQKNYYDEPSLQVVDNSGIRLEKGAAIASNSFLAFVGKVVSECKDRGYIVTEASLPLNTTRELDIKTSASNTYIKLSVERAVEYQIEDMNNALVYLNANNIHPAYVDVRISGKAYYK